VVLPPSVVEWQKAKMIQVAEGWVVGMLGCWDAGKMGCWDALLRTAFSTV